MKPSVRSMDQYHKMTETPIPRLILSLGFPTIISMLTTSLYNMADTYFVGTLGKSASGAIGVIFSLMAIFQAFGFTCGQGAGSIISRKLGQQDADNASAYATVGFWLSVLIGALIGLSGLLLLEPLMYLLGSTDTILPYAKAYARWILLAAPLYTSSCVLNNILRYEGMSFYAMIGLTAGGVLNMILNPVCIFLLHMGTSGAGLATALSQGVSFIILLRVFLMGKTQSRLGRPRISPSFAIQIVKIGFPALLRQGLGSFSTMVLNHQAGIYGDAAVAAMSIITRITNFIFSVGIGIGQGFQPVAAFNFGAGRLDRVRRGFWFTTAVGEALLGILALCCFLCAPSLAVFFQPDPAVVSLVIPTLRLHCISCLFLPFNISGNMMFQSTGYAVRSAILSALRNGICFIPLIFVLSALIGFPGIQLSQPLADLISLLAAIIMVSRFFSKTIRP